MVNALLLGLGFLLDALLGDPQGKWHPVALIGLLIEKLEGLLFPKKRNFRQEFVLGFVLLLVLLGGLGTGYFLLGRFLWRRFPVIFFAVELYLMFSFLALRTLRRRGEEVKEALERGDLPEARRRLRHLVGRDTEHLSEWEVVRGCVESLAENFSDGFLAPLFYMSILGALGGLLYKITNTLDSMIGHKDFRYFFFGFASARFDDILNFVPARLSVLFIALGTLFAGGNVRRVFLCAFRDAGKHESPNAGWPESGMAGALGVRLGGVNYYGGKREEMAFLGDPLQDLTVEKIDEALTIIHRGGVAAGGVFVVISFFLCR
ncbi:MAG: adenosylcobinamide-phosphate synthase CbiB [Treponemataceae bacterium]|nr:adenosylcobinamide-phosphate synthase CbiB [Treponemataceae bacterium]